MKSSSDLSGAIATPISLIHCALRSGFAPSEPEHTMAGHRPIRLPKQWSKHVKTGVLHPSSLTSVAISCAHGRATGQRRLRAQLEQATSEIARCARNCRSRTTGGNDPTLAAVPVVCFYLIARNSRRCTSPSGMTRSRHSSLIERK